MSVALTQLEPRQASDASAGRAVDPPNTELTARQAADMLPVSRRFVDGLFERGELPFHVVGAGRRVPYGDVAAYKRREYEARQKALDELVLQARELDMGY